MKIAILVEGRTETAFKSHLVRFLRAKLGRSMPALDFVRYDGRIPTRDKLQRTVEILLRGLDRAHHVIALADVYTGTRQFRDGADDKRQMRERVGANPRFHAHVAQHDFEAWLLPYWSRIQQLVKSNRRAPAQRPESVDHVRPPAYRLREVFRAGMCRDDYVKPRDANRILQDQDLSVAAGQCPELKAFLNTILTLSGAAPLV